MFLGMFSDAQKRSFMALATKVVIADGTVAPRENVTLDIRRMEMGGDVEAPPEEIYGAANTAVFDTRISQVVVLLELYVLAYSDDHFAPEERPILAELSDAFGISPDENEAMEAWARKQAPLSVEGWDMIMGTLTR